MSAPTKEQALAALERIVLSDWNGIGKSPREILRSFIEGAAEQTPELGDTVLHKPSGEQWLVAYVRDGRLAACGWPDEIVPASDCALISRMPLGKKLSLLRLMATSTGHRAEYARSLLHAACLSTEIAASPIPKDTNGGPKP
jgi:hypothetical protein